MEKKLIANVSLVILGNIVLMQESTEGVFRERIKIREMSDESEIPVIVKEREVGKRVKKCWIQIVLELWIYTAIYISNFIYKDMGRIHARCRNLKHLNYLLAL